MEIEGLEKVMRFAPVITLLAGFSVLAATAYEAAAQNRGDQRPRVFIKKRSYLDAGTVIMPGSKNYHDHIFTSSFNYPTLNADPTGHSRYPLPRQFELPNY
jgi:hypothetical protein